MSTWRSPASVLSCRSRFANRSRSFVVLRDTLAATVLRVDPYAKIAYALVSNRRKSRMIQQTLFDVGTAPHPVKPFTKQLLKWIGNKQRFAHEIVSYLPDEFGTYYEPFIGSGAVLATLS